MANETYPAVGGSVTAAGPKSSLGTKGVLGSCSLGGAVQSRDQCPAKVFVGGQHPTSDICSSMSVKLGKPTVCAHLFCRT